MTDLENAALASSGDHAELIESLKAEAIDPFAPGLRHVSFVNPDGPAAADAIEALIAEVAALRAERDDADRRAGAAERELESKSDRILKRERWLRNAKEARGYHQNISFDRVWSETCAAADRATEAERKLAEAERVMDEIAESAQITRARHLARTFLSSKEAERG